MPETAEGSVLDGITTPDCVLVARLTMGAAVETQTISKLGDFVRTSAGKILVGYAHSIVMWIVYFIPLKCLRIID